MLSIAIGCDDAAIDMKNQILAFLQSRDLTVVDYSCDQQREPTLYPDIAIQVAQAIKDGKHERGILICGTGIGMSITANKVLGIRAAQCHDPFSAQRARKSNNAQIICLGARVIGIELAKTLVDTWLDCDFDGGGSTEKVERISYYEQRQNI
ncbi:ribose-5-phosphate isomerase B [Yersinia mollaretii]|uniref:ribose 5-phosphate isomerase B n=1 Tax=Yersinia mollaretii TaxID=33060 RepID=UPI0005DEC996|nr:ribose 5-phosphate isomerase B [Yersinia mollaretii]CNK15083.1 ribose-5-phosphate isomerase B [Yersinia mollaretii]